MIRLLLVEDKDSLAVMLQEALRGEGYEVDRAATGTDGIQRLQRGDGYAAVLTDLRLPGADGVAVLRAVKEFDPECPVIMMTAFGTIEGAVEAMKLGAFDFVQKPVDLDHLSILVKRCLELRELRYENLLLRDDYRKRHGFPRIIGESAAITEVSRQIQRVAITDSTVLLLGESGTGKELFARAIHHLSDRRDRPFVAINCAAIPETLLENELFGHERGAYTGASSRQVGKFELADGGTIFLDEIGEIPLSMQSKILRVVQERTVERIGGPRTIRVDVRIVCATNRDLEKAVSDGAFREDLFYRINVFPVVIPPLRARREDVRSLVDYFVERFRREMKRSTLTVTDAARQQLQSYDWPGNVRELENMIERAAILCDADVIDVRDLALPSTAREMRQPERVDLSGTLAEVSQRAAEMAERQKIIETLSLEPNRHAAAGLLGISYRTLQNKMKQFGLAAAEGDE